MQCQIPPSSLDSSGCLKLKDFEALKLSGCEVPEGTCFTMEEEAAATAPSVPKRKEKHMSDPVKATAPVKATPPAKAEVAHEAVEVKEVMAAPPVETKAVVEQPAVDPAAQLANLASQKDLGGYGLIAGVVAVVGGGAAIKFYRDWIKGRQEIDSKKSEQDFELRKMELENKKFQQDEGHKACSIERAAMAAQIAGLTAQLQTMTTKLEEAQSKASNAAQAAAQAQTNAEVAVKKAEKLDLGEFDPEEAEERLSKVEKAVTALKKGKKAGA